MTHETYVVMNIDVPIKPLTALYWKTKSLISRSYARGNICRILLVTLSRGLTCKIYQVARLVIAAGFLWMSGLIRDLMNLELYRVIRLLFRVPVILPDLFLLLC